MWEIDMTAAIGGSMPRGMTLQVVLGGHTFRRIQAQRQYLLFIKCVT